MVTRTPALVASVPLVTTLVALLAGCSPPTSGAAPSGPPAVSEAPSSATGSECPNAHGGTCLGPIPAGEYRTTTFQPQTSYTVPDGWTNFEDLPGNFLLFHQQDTQDGALGGSYLGIYSNVHAAAISCAETAQSEVGTTPAELIAWYQSVPGLIVSEPLAVTVGGLDGHQIDLSLEPGVDTCTWDVYAGIPLIVGDGVSQLHHVIFPELDVRLILLESPDGNLTLEVTNTKEQHSAEEFRALLQPIIDSLVFAE